MTETKPIEEFSGRYSFLSNFSPAPVYILIGTKWVRCPTVEHGYQASKTGSQHWRRRIAEAKTPGEAKRMGRARTIHRLSYWDDVKTVVMLELLRQKFSRSALRERLLRTGDAQLVEGNTWHDTFWGVCNCGACEIETRGDWRGENWLGRLLMRVRRDVR